MHAFAKKKFKLTRQKCARTGSTLGWAVGVLAVISMMTATWMVSFRGASSGNTDVLLHTVARGDFTHEVVEQGEVESASEVKARNSTGTRILEVVEEGTNAKEGDLLCRLEASGFEMQSAISRRSPGGPPGGP